MNVLQLIKNAIKRFRLKKDRYILLNVVYEMMQILNKGIPDSFGWYRRSFQTNLGNRIVYCKKFQEGASHEVIHLLYWENENSSEPLFTINMSDNSYKYFNYSGITEDQAWLAIHELEELSYKELEKL